jgi:hypothetical protein
MTASSLNYFWIPGSTLINNTLPHILVHITLNDLQSSPQTNLILWGQESERAEFLVYHDQSNDQGIEY